MSIVSLDPKQEKSLVEKAKQDPEQFGKLYQHYYTPILRYFQARLKDQLVTEDLTSQVFEKALKNLAKFDWQGVSFSSWLYRIARNCLIDYLRKPELRHRGEMPDEQLITNAETSTQSQIEQDYQSELLLKILNTLPAREREVVYMKFYAGYTNKTIAEITNLTETNIGTIIYRAIKQMQHKAKKLQ